MGNILSLTSNMSSNMLTAGSGTSYFVFSQFFLINLKLELELETYHIH